MILFGSQNSKCCDEYTRHSDYGNIFVSTSILGIWRKGVSNVTRNAPPLEMLSRHYISRTRVEWHCVENESTVQKLISFWNLNLNFLNLKSEEETTSILKNKRFLFTYFRKVAWKFRGEIPKIGWLRKPVPSMLGGEAPSGWLTAATTRCKSNSFCT